MVVLGHADPEKLASGRRIDFRRIAGLDAPLGNDAMVIGLVFRIREQNAAAARGGDLLGVGGVELAVAGLALEGEVGMEREAPEAGGRARLPDGKQCGPASCLEIEEERRDPGAPADPPDLAATVVAVDVFRIARAEIKKVEHRLGVLLARRRWFAEIDELDLDAALGDRVGNRIGRDYRPMIRVGRCCQGRRGRGRDQARYGKPSEADQCRLDHIASAGERRLVEPGALLDHCITPSSYYGPSILAATRRLVSGPRERLSAGRQIAPR
jgi:hypothetical protein